MVQANGHNAPHGASRRCSLQGKADSWFLPSRYRSGQSDLAQNFLSKHVLTLALFRTRYRKPYPLGSTLR